MIAPSMVNFFRPLTASCAAPFANHASSCVGTPSTGPASASR